MSFGSSVSDVVVLGELLYKIIETVRNAGSEYQELTRELESLKKALDHVDKLRSQPRLAKSVEEITSAALTCRYPLETFLAKIRKHEKSLGLGKTEGRMKDMGSTASWALGRKQEKFTKLRDNLTFQVATINMMLVTRALEQLDANSIRAAEAHEELNDHLERSSVELSVRLSNLQGDVQAQSLTVRDNTSIIAKIFEMISEEVVAPIKILSEMVSKIYTSTQEIYSVFLDTRFTYSQAPVKVEDVLGLVFPFPSECSLEALNAEIKVRFKEGLGRREVLAGDYEIFNARNPAHVLTITGNNSLIPGMSIHMAVVVEAAADNRRKCPRLQCPSRIFTNATYGGKMW
ncbi:MAG: hypothetical protein Q9195_004737 [Heterodermia aff. obscurata]